MKFMIASAALAFTLGLSSVGCSPERLIDAIPAATPNANSGNPPSSAGSSGTSSGGSSSNVTTNAPVATVSPLIVPRAWYHAYGDSITAGYAVSQPQSFPALLAAYSGLQLSSYALDDDMACDLAPRQVFPNADSPTLAQPAQYTLLVSTSDAAAKGAGAYEPVFNLCHQATIAWLALPAEDKILATDPAVTLAGIIHLESGNNWNAMTSDLQNSSITFPIQIASAAPLYAWYRLTDGNLGTFSYSLDGVILGTSPSFTTPGMSTTNGTSSSLGLLRLPSVPAGAHTLTFTQTSIGAAGMGIVAIGIPPATLPPTMPQVYVGLTPLEEIGSGATCDVNPATCLAYLSDIAANVSLLQADGLTNVRLFDSRKYMTGTSADMADPTHPNSTGHQQIARAITDILIP